MSAGFQRGEPQDLVAELAARRGAVIALVTLGKQGGHGSFNEIRTAAGREAHHLHIDDLCWLVTVGLLRRDSTAGTWDMPDPTARYRLTQVGASLHTSLTALVEAMSTPSCALTAVDGRGYIPRG